MECGFREAPSWLREEGEEGDWLLGGEGDALGSVRWRHAVWYLGEKGVWILLCVEELLVVEKGGRGGLMKLSVGEKGREGSRFLWIDVFHSRTSSMRCFGILRLVNGEES